MNASAQRGCLHLNGDSLRSKIAFLVKPSCENNRWVDSCCEADLEEPTEQVTLTGKTYLKLRREDLGVGSEQTKHPADFEQ